MRRVCCHRNSPQPVTASNRLIWYTCRERTCARTRSFMQRSWILWLIPEYKHETHSPLFVRSMLVLYVLNVCLSATLTDMFADTRVFLVLPSTGAHRSEMVKQTLAIEPNSKHWFTTSFLWRKVPESDARSVISTRTFRRALTASVDSCAERKSTPSVV